MFRVREVQATHVFQLSTVQEIQHRYFIEQLILLRKLNTKTQFSFNDAANKSVCVDFFFYIQVNLDNVNFRGP